jgi:hypothetical protein
MNCGARFNNREALAVCDRHEHGEGREAGVVFEGRARVGRRLFKGRALAGIRSAACVGCCASSNAARGVAVRRRVASNNNGHRASWVLHAQSGSQRCREHSYSCKRSKLALRLCNAIIRWQPGGAMHNKSANTDPQLKAAASPRMLVVRLPLR